MASLLYMAVFSFIFILLSYNVIKGRQHHHVLVGDNSIEEMRRRIRAQANYAEYTVLFLLLLYISELNGLSTPFIHLFGITYLIARLSHAFALLKAEKMIDGKLQGLKFRISGMMLTFACIGLLAIYLLVVYLAS